MVYRIKREREIFHYYHYEKGLKPCHHKMFGGLHPMIEKKDILKGIYLITFEMISEQQTCDMKKTVL